jgi:hypothetical protein
MGLRGSCWWATPQPRLLPRHNIAGAWLAGWEREWRRDAERKYYDRVCLSGKYLLIVFSGFLMETCIFLLLTLHHTQPPIRATPISHIITIPYHNLGLGTYCGFPPVGWVHIGYLFLMVFILVSTEATSDVGKK